MTSSTTSAEPVALNDCKHCGHPIGYHHAEGDKCTCLNCTCPGYEPPKDYARAPINGVPSNLPTLLTIFRIAMGPVIAGLVLWAASELYSDRVLAGLIFILALVLFVIAALTDWFDGWLARKLNAVTPLGAALDHAADKVLITCVLVALAYAALPWMLVAAAVLILGRDVAVAGLREGISAQGKTLPVSQLGKWKAAAEMAGVGAFLAFQASALLLAPQSIVVGLDWAARILLWAAAALALISGAQYVAALTRKT